MGRLKGWLIVVGLLGGSRAAADVSLVQKGFGYDAGTGHSLALGSPIAAGNTLLVFAAWEDPDRVAAVTDSQGNAYVSAPAAVRRYEPTRGSMTQFFVASNVTGGATTVSVAVSGDGGTGVRHVGVGVLEYAGLGSSEIIQAVTAVGLDGSYAAQTPPVTVEGEALLLEGFTNTFNGGVIDAGPPWTPQLLNEQFYVLVADQLVEGAGSYQASATMPTPDGFWSACLVALKVAAPDAGPAIGPRVHGVGCGCGGSEPSVHLLVLCALLFALRSPWR